MNINLNIARANASPESIRFVWDDVRATGISSFDHDHHIISLALGVLETSLIYGALPGVLEKTVQFITDHTRLHFIREELVMDRLGYEGLKAHADAHDEMRSMITNELSMLDAQPSAWRHDLLGHLHAWWTEHTSSHDAQYTAFLTPRAHEVRNVIAEHNLNWM